MSVSVLSLSKTLYPKLYLQEINEWLLLNMKMKTWSNAAGDKNSTHPLVLRVKSRKDE